MRTLAWTRDVPRAVSRVAIGCLAISLLSLLAAYFVAPGAAWTYEFREWHHRPLPGGLAAHTWFGPTIVYIEFLHSVVIAALSIYLLGFAYRAEFVRTVHFLAMPRFASLTRTTFRFVAVGGLIAILGFLVVHHLDRGPRELQVLYEQRDLQPVPAARAFATYRLPYLLYFPYSFISFVCGMGPIVIVCVFAIFRDVSTTIQDWLRRRRLSRSASAAEQIVTAFKTFYEHSMDRCGRYTALAIALVVYVLFERYVGVYSTTRSAEAMARVGMQVVGAYGISIAVVILLYVAGYEEALRTVKRVGGDEKAFAKENHIGGFLVDLWARYLWLNLGVLASLHLLYPQVRALWTQLRRALGLGT